MEEFITDKRTGLRYELVGDYYLIAGEDEPEGRPIGIWGQRHLQYIRKHKVGLYAELLELSRSHGPEEAEEPTEPTRRIDFDHLQFGKDYEIK